MKKLYGYLSTEAVCKDIEERIGKRMIEVSKEEYEELLNNYETDYERQYFWTKGEKQLICTLNHNEFFKIDELGIYIAEDSDEGAYYYGEIGDASQFFEGYLTYYTGEDELMMRAIHELVWYDEEDVCYKDVQSFIAEQEDEEDGKDSIEFHGNRNSHINREIAELIGDKEGENYEVGTYLNRPIFEINDKLYYLTNDSYTFNTEFHWYLREVGKKCYEHFGY